MKILIEVKVWTSVLNCLLQYWWLESAVQTWPSFREVAWWYFFISQWSCNFQRMLAASSTILTEARTCSPCPRQNVQSCRFLSSWISWKPQTSFSAPQSPPQECSPEKKSLCHNKNKVWNFSSQIPLLKKTTTNTSLAKSCFSLSFICRISDCIFTFEKQLLWVNGLFVRAWLICVGYLFSIGFSFKLSTMPGWLILNDKKRPNENVICKNSSLLVTTICYLHLCDINYS